MPCPPQNPAQLNPCPNHCSVWALVSGKGGVGKSTLALALADALVSSGQQVAVVDLDPQAGLTTFASLKSAATPLSDAPHDAKGFNVFASSRLLAQASRDDLARHVERSKSESNIVLLDLSPSLTDASHAAALYTATLFLVIARTDAAGLPNVAEAIVLARRAKLPFVVVPSMRNRTALSRDSEALLRERYGDAVTTTVIPMDARAAEAAGIGRPLTQTAPRSRAAVAIHALATELLQRVDHSSRYLAPTTAGISQ